MAFNKRPWRFLLFPSDDFTVLVILTPSRDSTCTVNLFSTFLGTNFLESKTRIRFIKYKSTDMWKTRHHKLPHAPPRAIGKIPTRHMRRHHDCFWPNNNKQWLFNPRSVDLCNFLLDLDVHTPSCASWRICRSSMRRHLSTHLHVLEGLLRVIYTCSHAALQLTRVSWFQPN